MHQIKSGKLSDLYPVRDIRKDEIETLSEMGYSQPVDRDTFSEKFPWIPLDKAFISKVYTEGVLYYDEKRYICFSLGIYGDQSVVPSDVNPEKMLKRQLSRFEKAIEEKDYRYLILMAPSAFKIELMGRIIEENPDGDLIEMFRDAYTSSDFGFDLLPVEAIVAMYEKASPEFKHSVREKVEGKEKIVIYRGQAEKSTHPRRALSWTTSLKTACFFAVRYAKEEALVIKAAVSVDDIFDFIDERNENEVLIRPGSYIPLEYITLPGIELLRRFPIKPNHFVEAKRLYKHSYGDHEESHVCRMIVLQKMICSKIAATPRDKRILNTAILYHDLGRVEDGIEEGHGEASVKLFLEKCPAIKDQDIIKDLIQYHCVDDEEAFKQLKDKKEGEYRIRLLKLLKDIDGLDRIRFGLEELDLDYLRNPESIQYLLMAKLLQRFTF